MSRAGCVNNFWGIFILTDDKVLDSILYASYEHPLEFGMIHSDLPIFAVWLVSATSTIQSWGRELGSPNSVLEEVTLLLRSGTCWYTIVQEIYIGVQVKLEERNSVIHFENRAGIGSVLLGLSIGLLSMLCYPKLWRYFLRISSANYKPSFIPSVHPYWLL